jgi:hypothetical protein
MTSDTPTSDYGRQGAGERGSRINATKPPTALDGGSYLTHYGLLNPWSLWLARAAPEHLGNQPHTLSRHDSRPPCPDPWCRHRMVARDGYWKCYRHNPPRVLRAKLPVPDVKWAPGQPPALSLIGKDIDIEWSPEQGGYVVKRATKEYRPCQDRENPPTAPSST